MKKMPMSDIVRIATLCGCATCTNMLANAELAKRWYLSSNSKWVKRWSRINFTYFRRCLREALEGNSVDHISWKAKDSVLYQRYVRNEWE